MIDPGIPPLIDDMAARLHKAYAVAPDTLQRQMKKIGSRMPAKQRRMVRVLADAEQVIDHPKLARQANLTKVQRAHAGLIPFLDKQDPDAKLTRSIIGIITTIAINLLILTILIVVAYQLFGGK